MALSLEPAVLPLAAAILPLGTAVLPLVAISGTAAAARRYYRWDRAQRLPRAQGEGTERRAIERH